MLRRSESTGWRSPFSSGKELLDRGEDHAAGGDRELRAQVGAVRGLHRRLAQQVAAAREGAEELVVEVVAVGEHDDRSGSPSPGAGSRGPRRTPSSGSCPSPACARPRRRAGRRARRPAVAGLVAAQRLRRGRRLRRAQRLLHRHVHGVELVVARHLLGELARRPSILEHDEVAQQIEEAALLEHAFQHHLQLGHAAGGVLAPGDRAPGLEPFLARAERADARLHAVGDDQRRVGSEERRDLRLVGLKLLESATRSSRSRRRRS